MLPPVTILVGEHPDVLRTVRQAVLSLKPQGRSHVQALCDMLLRCAATHYFEQQVLPARSKPEVTEHINMVKYNIIVNASY